MSSIKNSEKQPEGDSKSSPFKEAFLNNNIKEILNLMVRNLIPSSEELLFILSHNHELADYLALKNIEGLRNYLNISA